MGLVKKKSLIKKKKCKLPQSPQLSEGAGSEPWKAPHPLSREESPLPPHFLPQGPLSPELPALLLHPQHDHRALVATPDAPSAFQPLTLHPLVFPTRVSGSISEAPALFPQGRFSLAGISGG